MRVAIQGIAGSFHDEAAGKLLAGKHYDLVACDSFRDVFEAVSSGKADLAVVAVENSLHGSINEVYRLLASARLWIAAEVYLHIDQYLISAKPADTSDLTKFDKIISHPVAIAQCENWLSVHQPQAHIEESHDTAASVRLVVSSPKKAAAIAGKHAAEIYGGSIVAGPINDDPHNYTRFILLKPNQANSEPANKTSIILQTNHKPGALYRALKIFADSGINLSKLDSHPIPGDKWHYAFYVDFDAAVNSPPAAEAISKLEAQACKVRVLGSYIGGSLPE